MSRIQDVCRGDVVHGSDYTMIIRSAEIRDAKQMAHIVNDIIKRGGTTAHEEPFNEDGVERSFIHPRFGISCLVAEDGDKIHGFQSLEWSDPDWIGDDKIPASWAIISSFVEINKHRRGIGKALFQQTTKYAQEAQVEYIEATIRADNENGLRYYSSLGFYEYDVLKGVALSNGVLVDRIRKKFKVQLNE